MYIDNSIITSSHQYKSYSSDGINYYYTPIIFTKNTEAGEETIKYVADQYKSNDSINFIELLGSYKVVIEDTNKGEVIFFTDNSNLRSFYMNGSKVSDSFLELLENGENLELNYDSVVEYLYFGKNYFHKTYVKNIDRSSREHYYVIKDGVIEEKSKNIYDLDNKDIAIDVYEFSDILKRNLTSKEEKKGLSLTGGFDSRYVLSMLNSDTLDITLYSSVEDYPDSRVSRKIANTLNKKFKVFIIGRPDVVEEDIVKLFDEQDAYMSFFLGVDFAYKMPTFLGNMKEEGYSYLLTGDTGTYHKDDDWQDEILNYNNPKTNTVKFFNNRMKPSSNTGVYTDRSKAVIESAIKDILNWLDNNKQSINTESIDWFKWHLLTDAYTPLYYNTKSSHLEVYAPLIEYRFIANSYHLKRSQRKFGRYMAAFISEKMPDVAQIPTVLGTTTSNRKRDKVRNVLFNGINFGVRAIRLVNRKLFGKGFMNYTDNWSLDEFVRESNLASKAISFGEGKGLINKGYSSIDDETIARLIEVYLVSKKISCK